MSSKDKSPSVKNKASSAENKAGLTSRLPYPASRLSPPIDLVNTAQEIAKADEFIALGLNARLDVIAEQIRGLQEQAREILSRAEENRQLHRAACNFQRRVGQCYHLYRKGSDELYFSMLSPDDWNRKSPHEYQGSYLLQADMSWQRVEEEN